MLRIYKSSAGSGKTYTLVKEYIRIAMRLSGYERDLATEDKFKHILAITFTNKAANEVKERIIQTLEQIKSNEPKVAGLIKQLAEETGLEEIAIVNKSGRILRNMLHSYSDISVSTIDSFVHRVIRSFTYDLNLPMNFEVEMDRDKLLTETIEILMDRLSDEDDQLTSAVVEFAETNITEGKSWNLEHSLIGLGKELFNEDAYQHLEKLEALDLEKLKKVRETLYQHVNGFEQKLFNEGKKAIELITGAGLSSASFFQTTKGIFGFFNKYSEEEFPNDVRGNSYVQKTIADNKWGGGKTRESDLISIEGIKESLIRHYHNISAMWDGGEQDYYLAKLLLRNFYSFILLADIQKLMHEYKKENNIVHISEFQEKVHAIVKEQDAPVIYERIGEWYDSILIDEHQDTSVLQWQNLLPLIENSQFKSEDSLVVGDGKQAIYRFRNGKVEQFAVLPKIYNSENDMRLKEREVAITNYGTQTQNLGFNYRSRKEVVDFNNTFYDTLAELPELKNKTIYEDQAQKQGRDLAGGQVQIEFLRADNELLLDDNRCRRVEDIVYEVLNRGYSLQDIAVLTRSNKNGSLIASRLIGKGIHVISSESLLINNSPKVKLILAALGYFDQPRNHIARAEMTYYIHLLLLKKQFRFEQFDFKNTDSIFEEDLSALIGKEFRSYNFLSFQLTALIHQLMLFFDLGDDDPFLQFFQDETMVFASRNRSNIREFLDWWEEVKINKSIIYPDTLDAVKIMTMHKSKGLQFPVVIMADADWPQKNSKKNFWVDIDKFWLSDLNTGLLPAVKDVLQTEYAPLYEEEEASSFLDMLNLLYVGTTRPEDLLYILSTGMKREPERNNSVTALLISFLKKHDLWEGFKTYSFGDVDTTKYNKQAKKVLEERIYKKDKLQDNTGSKKELSIKKNSQLLWGEDSIEKIDQGNLLHGILKRIKYSDDTANVLGKTMNEGLITLSTRIELEKQITALLQNPTIAAYFKAPYKVINERPLLGVHGLKIPDRVVVDGNRAVVIDYKTGTKRSSNKTQLKEYADEIRKFGFEEVKGFLIYTQDNWVEEI